MYRTISLLSDETVRIWWSDPRIELGFLIRSESYPEEALLPRGSKSILINKLVQTKNLYLTAFLFNETKPITPHIIETRSHTRSFSRVQSYMYFYECIVSVAIHVEITVKSRVFLFLVCLFVRLIFKGHLVPHFCFSEYEETYFNKSYAVESLKIYVNRSRLRNRPSYCLYATSVYWLYVFIFCFLIFCTTMPNHATRPHPKISTGT